MQLGALVAVFLVPNLSQVTKHSMVRSILLLPRVEAHPFAIQGDFNLMFVGLAACLLTSFLGVMIKQPTPIGGRFQAYSELARGEGRQGNPSWRCIGCLM